LLKAGRSKEAKIAMIAITTSNSISVKPAFEFLISSIPHMSAPLPHRLFPPQLGRCTSFQMIKGPMDRGHNLAVVPY
jgi:hypothetical protein